MNCFRKFSMQLIVIAFIVLVSIPMAFSAGELDTSGSEAVEPAAEQVVAGISPAHETKIGTSSASFYKRLHWGGGRTSIYRIVYNDGITDAIVDNNANYYARDYTRVYSKSSVLSQRTWNTQLTVINGPTAYAYGSVTLKDR